MKKTIKKIISFTLSIAILELSILSAKYINTFASITKPEISSEAAILMDGSSKEILYEKNKDKKYNPASITKIMTALLVIENGNLDDSFTFSNTAVSNLDAGAVTLGAKAGDRLGVRDALYGLMLRSANEIGNGLAEYISTSIPEFAKKMTKKAKELGATNTNFVNPHGLTNTNHYTTAYDMALITKAAFENPIFREIEATTSYNFPSLGTNPARLITMGHKMTQKDDSRYYEGILGGKTGYTKAAGNTLVTVVERNGIRLIVVILKSSNTHYQDTKALLDYGFALKGVANNFSTPNMQTNNNTNNNTSNNTNLVGPGANLGANTNNTNNTNNTSLVGPGQISEDSGLKQGWNKDDRGWRYVKANKSIAVNERLDIDSNTYWFDADSYMATGWRQDNMGSWYYMKESGEMRKSKWILYNNLWYYLGSDGIMLRNTTTPDGYKVNNDGVWIQ